MEFSKSLPAVIDEFNKPDKIMSYGTAGFRDNWKILHSVFNRMGILACMRSLSLKGSFIGIMITASHNEEHDNGIKLVDADGGMLTQTWEPYAEVLANTSNSNEAIIFLHEMVTKEKIMTPHTLGAIVVLGRDTRPHSHELANCSIRGIEGFGGTVFDLGEVTTPQLHFVVKVANLAKKTTIDIPLSLSEYYDTLSSGFISLLSSASKSKCMSVIVDVAGGVGEKSLRQMVTKLNLLCPGCITVDIRNPIGSLPVNKGCGAEFVQKTQSVPTGIDAVTDRGQLLCSFDGDADRIVFHSFITDNTSSSTDSSSSHPNSSSTNFNWILLDGDKIATLFATFLRQEMLAANLPHDLTLGVVQTAYANGASSHHIRSQGITVAIAKTGVKFLHPKAEEFDIGVYFEANGHGTVLFSEKIIHYLETIDWTKKKIDSNTDSVVNAREVLAIERLKGCYRVINQAVGDALSDMLFTLAILEIMDMDVMAWNNLYQDLPSRQVKVPVGDKSLIICNEDETKVSSPSALQQALDVAMSSYSMGRCFVRPSGTEDVVRVYAEATSQAEADELAIATIEIIHEYIGVLGDRPSTFSS
eukprot:gene4587-9116_t